MLCLNLTLFPPTKIKPLFVFLACLISPYKVSWWGLGGQLVVHVWISFQQFFVV